MSAMQKLLNGRDLADYIKERQGGQVRALVQAHGIKPKLAILTTGNNSVIEVYMRMKQRYGADIGVEVEIHTVDQAELLPLIKKLNNDDSVQAMIVQLPLQDPSQTDEVVDAIAPAKDVDALGKKAIYEPATPLSILWLLAGYNVDLKTQHILLIGRGKLVGAPLERMFTDSKFDFEVANSKVTDLKAMTLKADVIITATGRAGIVRADMIKPGAVVVDAGTASEGGKTVGDLDPDVYERDDITLTPKKGGVGPLTVCALFENTIRACQELQK
jgi:methylenetetrahydrofolate dehydrogenase (NADP+) / methenyltetrahydrofolate cyclohydrolase